MTVSSLVDAKEPDKLSYSMRIVAQDQTVAGDGGNPLLATVQVPSDRFQPGPHSHRLRVIDYDASTGRLKLPAPVAHPPSEAPSKSDRATWGYVDPFATRNPTARDIASGGVRGRQFRCQNVYAIAARTLAEFESALGRRLPWGFGSHELYLVPHAFAEANAYYSRDDHAILFGYVDDGDRRIYTSLSHDIVAHETTHALLDGLRPGFMKPGLPDQSGFHEAFADIVALLSVFSVPELIAELLGGGKRDQISTARLTRQSLQEENPLFALAEDLGSFLGEERGDGLRRSVLLEPGDSWKEAQEYREPHRRGEVLVAATMRTLLDMWIRRLEPLVEGRRTADRARAAEEGAKSAEHLLKMSIRAIDYTPPLEFEFSDFVAAVIKSDMEVAPMDEHNYRTSLVNHFRSYGIEATENQIHDLTRSAPLYAGLNFTAMRSQPDEIYRFIWGNARFLNVEPDYYLEVETVRPSTRIGPDGLIVDECAATYMQMVDGTAKGIAQLSRTTNDGRRSRRASPRLKVPSDLDDTQVQLFGGGTLIFDQFGRLKYHHQKPLFDWNRQQRRFDHLVRSGIQDSSGRFGFSTGASRGQQFAELHVSKNRAGEDW